MDCAGFKAGAGKALVIDLRAKPAKIPGVKKPVTAKLDDVGTRAAGAKGAVLLLADTELAARVARQKAIAASVPAEQVQLVRCPTPGK